MAFVNLDLEVTENCLSDYVLVESSSDLTQFNNLTKSCGSRSGLRRIFYHGTPNLRVNFVSDYFNNKTGFEATIFSMCGGILKGPNGEIPLRNQTTGVLQMPLMCNWTVSVQRGRKIKFTIERLSFPQHNVDCQSYFIFRDGNSDEAPFVGQGKFCSNINNFEMTTSGNKAFVQFDSGLNMARPTYRIKYEQIEPDCGGTSMLSTNERWKTISTPNYPNIPNPFSECIWKIIAPNGELMRIESMERFDLAQTSNCAGEYVEIRDGATAFSPLLTDRKCGSTFPTIFTGSNSLRIHYYSDITTPNNGFKFNVSLTQCGRSIVGHSGQIISPGYPNSYPPSLACEYHLMGDPGTNLNLTIYELDLPFTFSDCNSTDHLDIYAVLKNSDGTDSLDKIETICGRSTRSIIAESYRVLIKFITTGRALNRRGFRIGYESTGMACKYEMNAPNGEFTSPGYPRGRDVLRYCEWTITTPKGTRVIAKIEDFDIAERADMVQRGINFYNDFSNFNRIAIVNPGNATGRIIKSSDNKMFVRSFINQNEGHRGFKISFSSNEPSICAGNLDEEEGFIESPGFNESYLCEYSRSRPIGENNNATLGIRLNIKLENGTNCTRGIHTGVNVIYGPNIRLPIFNRCPPKYTNIATPTRATKVMVNSVARFSPNKFLTQLTYRIHPCGGILSDTQTQINILEPRLPVNYGEIDCAWSYATANSQKIKIIVSKSGGADGDCENEYINIYNGFSPASPKARTVCGTIANQEIELSSNRAFITYHSTNFTPSARYAISIEATDGACGGAVTAPNFIIQSPKNGTKYPRNSYCTWTIDSEPGFRVQLKFIQRFMLESSSSCTKDYIEIFDFIENETNESKQWKSLGRFCGRELPPILNSTSTKMQVIFKSDGDTDGDGFTIEWSQICGGSFLATETKQFIVSPRYPEKYKPNLLCNYTIYTLSEKYITIKFADFDLEDTSIACQFDNLTLYKPSYPYAYAMNKDMMEIGSYCSATAMQTFRAQYQMNLVFRTDSWYEKRGFKFSYSTDDCGGMVTSSGIIKSAPNEENGYLPNMNCLWNITAPEDKRITIRFELFELEHDSGCYLDFVEVFEGPKVDYQKRLSKLCGNMTGKIPSIIVPTNHALVKFISDTSSEYRGFRALILFQANCDQHFNFSASNPSVRLDKLYSQYPAMLDCQFSFHAPPGNQIQIKFSQLHLEPCSHENGTVVNSDPCSCDFLNVRDGLNPFSESIGTFCGHNTPKDILSSGNSLWMLFATDNSGFSTGFILTAQMVPSPCGAPTRRLDKDHLMLVIESPNDGTNYLPNMNCYWEIESPDSMIMDLKFEKLSLQDPDPQTRRCTADYLEIKESFDRYIADGLGENTVYAGGSTGGSLYYYGKSWPSSTHTYCGDAHPIDYFSSSSKITIHFKSDESVEKSGFKLIVKELNVCERNFTHNQGRVFGTKSPGCELFITSEPNTSISLYFSTFDFELFSFSESQTPHFVCTEDKAHITVYNAKTSELLQKLCGSTLPSPIFTNTNALKLKFKSTESNSMPLYDITYIASNKSRGCGGEVFNYAGTFSSPGYPNTDKNDSECLWNINVPQHLVVQLNFDVFDLGPRQLCEDNFVEVIGSDSPRRFCGSDTIATIKTKSNFASIRFKSGRNFAGSGWVVSFTAVHEEQ